MHHHLEIVMPPSSNINKAIEEIMLPFSENLSDEERIDYGHNDFWDWYVIGGRWGGTKQSCRYDNHKLEKFHEELQNKKITVSSIRCGKQELMPASQIPVVDKLWNSFFPTEDGTITPCPLFAHSNNQYDSNDLISCDICTFEEIPERLACSRVIFASHNHSGEGFEAVMMLSDSIWNGVNFENTAWSGKVKDAVGVYIKYIERFSEEHKAKVTPQSNWICITVDYHS